MGDSQAAVHRAIVVVDVEGFGESRRTLPHQLGIRSGLYRMVASAFDAAGISWDLCRCEDRGDGVFVLVPPEIPKTSLVEVVPEALARALREHNRTSPVEQRIRLRMAIHAGEVAIDRHGVTSSAVNTAFRLLDASLLKSALAHSLGVLALIVSQWVFDEVVRQSVMVDPATFRPVWIRVKETDTMAWIARPDWPYTASQAVLAGSARDAIKIGGGSVGSWSDDAQRDSVTASGEIDVDVVDDGRVIAVRAVQPVSGTVTGRVRAGWVKSGGEVIGVDLRNDGFPQG
jgi:hypothetical protein